MSVGERVSECGRESECGERVRVGESQWGRQ